MKYTANGWDGLGGDMQKQIIMNERYTFTQEGGRHNKSRGE